MSEVKARKKKPQKRQLAPPDTVRLSEWNARFLGQQLLRSDDYTQWNLERLFLGQAFVYADIAGDGGRDDSEKAASALVQAVGVLTGDSFVFEQHSLLWEGFVQWFRSGEDWDLLGMVDTAWPEGGILYCSEVLDLPMALPCGLKHSVRRLYEKQRQRDHAKVISEHKKRESSGKWSSGELQAQLTAALREWEEDNLLQDTRNIAEDMIVLLGDLEEAITNKKTLCAPTGITELDDVITGLMDGEYLVLAGRPGSGKTSLACNFVENTCARGGAAVFFSLEMTRKQLLARFIQQLTGVSADWILTGDRRIASKLASVHTAALEIADWNLKIYDHAALAEVDCCPALLEQARAEMGVEKIDLCVFDHLGEATKGATDKQAETTRKSGILRDMAKHTDVPVVALVQMNRDIEKGGGRDQNGKLKRLPMTSDLRDAGEIEEQASKILFTHNKEQLVLRKNRFGVAEAEIDCVFYGQRTRWGQR